MKPLVIFFLLATSIPSFSQISFFKQINDVEEGSYPSNFTEFKGEVYFTVQTVDGNRLWKTDGSEGGTVQVTDKNIEINYNLSMPKQLSRNIHLFVCNGELYFKVVRTNLTPEYEIWKTDGSNLTLVNYSYLVLPQFCLNDTPILEDYSVSFLKETQIENAIIKFSSHFDYVNGYSLYDVYKKTTNNEADDILIGSIENMPTISSGSSIFKNCRSVRINNEVFFIAAIYNQNNFNYTFKLWKTNGTSITYINDIITTNQYSNITIEYMTDFYGKLVFILKNNAEKKIWISNGTTAGTYQVENTNNVNSDNYESSLGILPAKFCFAKTQNGDTELWVSDGTAEGTNLLKDINPNGSSSPHNFVKVGNKVFFKTAQNELWQTDGTTEVTVFIYNIPTPENLYIDQGYPQFLITSKNEAYFSNYSPQTGYELYKSGGEVAGMKLLKNISTNKEPSINPISNSSTKVQMGGKWYFNGMDSRGSELWVSDGTPNGTKMVKDLNLGTGHTYIREIVSTNDLLLFTASQNNINKLFRSDGTSEGTFEIQVSPIIHPIFYPYQLTIAEGRFYFISRNSIWTSDGTIFGTNKIINANSFDESYIIKLIGIGEKCLIANGRIFITDFNGNSQLLFLDTDIDRPFGPINMIKFNNKVYFFASKILANNTDSHGFFETDGTKSGTKLIKDFSSDPYFLLPEYIFLEKTDTKMFFRANLDDPVYSRHFDLWTSDGTELGTYFLRKIDYQLDQRFFTKKLNNLFIMSFLTVVNQPTTNEIFISDGTLNEVNKIILPGIAGEITNWTTFNNKLYLPVTTIDNGTELWETDGTIPGTKLTAEIRPGQPNSQIGNLMNFEDKIVMSGTDGINGIALWQYIDNTQIKSIKSGNWDDPTTWNTGQIPVVTNNVTIDENHTVVIPAAIQANLFTIIIKNGGLWKLEMALFSI
jgi:ELWxxDGT repeat protein